MYGKVVQFRALQTRHALMCKIPEQEKISVLKHILCSLVDMSDPPPPHPHLKIFNIVVVKKNYNIPYNCSKMYLHTYVSDHVLVQFRSVPSITNELPLAFGTKAYILVPGITFLFWQYIQSQFWQCHSLRGKNRTPHPLLAIWLEY